MGEMSLAPLRSTSVEIPKISESLEIEVGEGVDTPVSHLAMACCVTPSFEAISA